MLIYDKTDRLILDIVVNDNSYRNRAIMGDHNLTLYYSLPEHVEIPVGAYCEFEGTRYFLLRPEQLKMKHTRHYDYTVTFSSDQDKAKIWKFRNPVDGRLKFPLTAKPKEHLQMFVDNMNKRDSGWTVGDCVDDVETLISYDHDYCWDALTKQATTFKTEFEIVEKRVSLRKVEYNKNHPLPLSYGRGNGFKSGIGRHNSGDTPPTEILFVQGGDRNIDRSKYPASETLRATSAGCLLLPAGQTIGYDGEHFEDENGYNPDAARHYVVDDLGLSIRNIDKALSTLAEDSLDRSDDYPKRVGTISRVDEVDKDKNFYDFIDSGIPAELNYEDYLIGDEQMTVVFQSGELSGREFDVKYYHEPKTIGGKNKAGRRFEIVAQEIDGMMMPGGSFVPKPGDTYAVFNVMLPDAYIRNDADKSGASWDMFRTAVKHLFDNEQMKFSFTGELDGLWAKKDWINIGGKIRLGGFVRFTNEQFEREGVLVRITNIKDYINNPHSPKIELSNETVSSSVSSTLKELRSTEVVIDENYRAALQFTKRRFRDAKETIEMLESALSDNFTSRINPIAVETMSLLVGDERLQYQFVAQPGSTEAVPHNIEWDKDNRQLIAPAGTIQHLTLGIDCIRPSHEPNEYLYWNVPSFESASLADGSVKYYLYIRAIKQFTGEAGDAVFRLETTAHKLAEGNYYWLLVGILNTEYNGERSFATLYGFTEILPGRITADRLLASDGQSYFDMKNTALKLKDKLRFNTSGDGELRIKGVIVQSQNGIDEAPLGCYRGSFDSQTTYFNGDEVSYQSAEGTVRSSYRCVSPTPISGIEPTNTLYWQVTAEGAEGAPGKDGSSIQIKGKARARFDTVTELEEFLDSSTRVPSVGDTYLVDSGVIEPADSQEMAYNIVYTLTKELLSPRPKWAKRSAAIGESYIIDATDSGSDGHLFVATQTGWNDVGVIKGEPGKDGEAGDYTEMRFASNGSLTQWPGYPNRPDGLLPDGWNTEMPTAAPGYYVWMTKAVKSGDRTTLKSQWSTPVRMSGADGRDGEDGKSPVLVFRGNYDANTTYYGTDHRLDCVRHDGAYYIVRIDAGIFYGISPTDAGQAKWNSFGASFESVATELLLAEHATIGNWAISGDDIISTHGKVNGVVSDDFADANFIPDVVLDGKNGSLRFANGMRLDTDGLTLISTIRGNSFERVKICNASIGKYCPNLAVKDRLVSISDIYTDHIIGSSTSNPHDRQTRQPVFNKMFTYEIGFLDAGSQIEIRKPSFNFVVPAINTGATLTATARNSCEIAILCENEIVTSQTFGSNEQPSSYARMTGSLNDTIQHTVAKTKPGFYSVRIRMTNVFLIDCPAGETTPFPVYLLGDIYFQRSNTERTTVANDGFMTIRGNGMLFSNSDASVIQHKGYAIKLSDEGIQKSTNATSQNAIWTNL